MISDYTIYDLSTGKVIKKCRLPGRLIDLNIKEGQGYIDGLYDADTHIIVDGMPTVREKTADELVTELAKAKIRAIREINRKIGAIRSEFVTVIPAQDMVYQAKEAEAKAYLADAAPVEADYPFINAEIGITGDSAWQVAQVYVNQALILRQTAAQLEAVRLGHVALVEAATDVGAIDAVLAQFNAALQ